MEGAKRKAQILEASARVFAAKGYFAASVQDIIDEAGVARGTFYLYFTSKRQVFTDVVESILESVGSRIRPLESRQKGTTAYDLIRDNIKSAFAYFLENPDYAKILLTHAPALDDASTRQFDEANYLLLKTIRNQLNHGIALDLFRDFNVELESVIMLGSLKELLYNLVITRLIEAPLDVVVDQVMQMFSVGVLKPGTYPVPGKTKKAKR